MVMNYFETLGLSVKAIEGQDEATVAKTVDAAHKKLYARTVGAYANVPRKDGRTQAQWQVILNEARDTLKDPQKRREHIAELPETRKAAKKAADKNAAKKAATKKAAVDNWAEVKQSVVRPAVEFVVKHAEIISAIGAVLVLLGAALVFLATPIGRDIFGLGTTVLWVGLPAFLYKGSRRRILVFGAAGIILLLLGSVLRSQITAAMSALLLTELAGLVVMCGLIAFLFQQSWHLKIVEVARRAAAWWMAWSAGWNPVFRIGATGLVLALALMVISLPLSILSGGAAAILGSIIGLLIWGGVFLIVAASLWWWFGERPRDIVECRDCGAKMARKRFYRNHDTSGCPACGSHSEPSLTGDRASMW